MDDAEPVTLHLKGDRKPPKNRRKIQHCLSFAPEDDALIVSYVAAFQLHQGEAPAEAPKDLNDLVRRGVKAYMEDHPAPAEWIREAQKAL